MTSQVQATESATATGTFEVETTELAMIVRGVIPASSMAGLSKMAADAGFDEIAVGAAKPLKATMVFVSDDTRETLIGQLEELAHEAAAGDRLVKWMMGTDTGISSLTIAAVLGGGGGGPGERRDVPYDPADFGRCSRLLEIMPEWKSRLGEVAEAYPRWKPLVDAWDELEALYQEELPSGRAPKLYERMQELLGRKS